MNSRSDWLVLRDYYSVYVTNDPPNANNTNLEKSGFVLFFAMFKHPPKFHLKFFQIFYVRKLNSSWKI